MKEYSITALQQIVIGKVRAVRLTQTGWNIQTVIDQSYVLIPVNDYHQAMQEVALRRFLMAVQMLGRTPEQMPEDVAWYDAEMGDWKAKLARFIKARQLYVTLPPKAQREARRAAAHRNLPEAPHV